jgi:hypothetical protein
MASSPCSASRSWFDVGTEPQPADLVAVLAARAEEENRQPGAVAETPTDIESGLAPEHHVEQHAIDAAPTEGSDCGRATRGRVHLEALRLQEIAHEPHDLRLVLDKQHRRPAVFARFNHCRKHSLIQVPTLREWAGALFRKPSNSESREPSRRRSPCTAVLEVDTGRPLRAASARSYPPVPGSVDWSVG